MHICPHCQKLGISSIAALSNTSRGLVSCRYCNNVSKRRPHFSYYVGVPIATLLYGAAIYFFRPPIEFVFGWLAIFMVAALMLIDRHIEFDKYVPREKVPDPLSTVPRKQEGAISIAVILVLLSLALLAPTLSRAELPIWLKPATATPMTEMRKQLRIDAESGLNPAAAHHRQYRTRCGDLSVDDDGNAEGTNNKGHSWSLDRDQANHLFSLTVDGNRWVAFTDDQGMVTEVRDPGNHSRHHVPLTQDQIKQALAAHHDTLVQLASGCGLDAMKVAVVAPKCGLDDNNFSAPGTKVCDLGSPWDDSGFWMAYFEPEFDVTAWEAAIAFETQQQCLARRSSCFDGCNIAYGASLALCAEFWFAPIAGAACVAGMTGIWGICLQRCSAIVC